VTDAKGRFRLAMGRASCAALIALAISGAARADGADTERADKLFREGRSAMKQRDYSKACGRFAESQRLDPAPGTLLNLSECEEALGRLADSWRHIQDTIAQLPANDDRLPLARERAASLDRRVPRISVRLAPGAPDQARLLLDRAQVSPSVPIPVDPGPHMLTAEAPGYRTRSTRVVIKSGETRSVEISAELWQPQDTSHASAGTETPVLGYTLGAIGIAGLGLAAVTGLMMNDKKGVVNVHCTADKQCDSDGYDAAQAGQRLQPLYIGGWIVGAVGVTAGAYLILRPSNKKSSTRLAASTIPGGGGVSFSGNFE
jgi:hypothetical protein